MAATPQEAARILNLEIQFANFLAGTIDVSALSGTQRHILIDAQYPIINGYRNRKLPGNIDFASWEVGDEVQNINDVAKQLVMGKVIATPFDPGTDLDDRSKFDWYIDAKPKL